MTVEFVDPPAPDSSREEILDVRRRRSWQGRLLIGLALAVVLAGLTYRLTQPDGPHRGKSGHRAAAPTAPPSRKYLTRVTDRSACRATLPTSWGSAIAAGATSYGKLQLHVVGVSEDGTPIVDYPPPGVPANTMAISVGTLPSDAAGPHLLATFSRHNSDSAGYSISVAGNTVVLGINFGRTGGKGVSSAPREIAVVDTRTGAETVLRNALDNDRITVGSIAVFDGVLYWDDYPHGVGQGAVVHAYDLAGRTDKIVYRGPSGSQPQSNAAGVWWGSGTALHPNRAAKLPEPVAQRAASEAARSDLTTDGTAWAWPVGMAIEWWAPGGTVIRTVLRNDGVFAVDGPLVFFSAGVSSRGVHVLDARTGAVAVLGDASFDTASRGFVYLQNDPNTITDRTAFTITRLDASALPPLAC